LLAIIQFYFGEWDMTVCIAAICEDGADEKLVLCSDRKLSSGLGSADVGKKDFLLPHAWRMLTAGNEGDYRALLKLYQLELLGRPKPSFATVDEVLKAPLFRRKQQIADSYIKKRFAITHAEFVANGKERLPADLYHDAMQRIGRMDLGAEVILAGHVEGMAEIYYTDADGSLHAVTNFATIGEGADLAHSILMRREQNTWSSLSATIYSVYEAKRYAESIGSVGKDTTISVVGQDGERKLLSFDLDKQLETAYEKYGPQKLPSTLKFDGEYYFKKSEEPKED
jgi:hypothetical protein